MTKQEVHYLKPDEDHSEARFELLKSQVQNLDEPKLLEFISQLETSWCLNCKGDRWIPITNGFKQFYSETELDSVGLPRELDMERVSDQHKRKQRALGEMYHRAVALEVAEKDSLDINGSDLYLFTS